jgi:hypothetical protein
VVKRLRIFVGLDDVIDIKSEPGHGTKVILTIPKTKGSVKDD